MCKFIELWLGVWMDLFEIHLTFCFFWDGGVSGIVNVAGAACHAIWLLVCICFLLVGSLAIAGFSTRFETISEDEVFGLCNEV